MLRSVKIWGCLGSIYLVMNSVDSGNEKILETLLLNTKVEKIFNEFVF